MEYRQLGRSGMRVSVVGLGANQFGGKVDAKGTERIIHRALDLGINFIDTADIYTGGRSEETIGAALKGRRAEAVLATKMAGRTGDGPNDSGASRWRIMRQVEISLKRLQTDYIDLYQIHWFDPLTPIEETMRALDDLVRSGKVRYIGASNFAAWQMCRANDLAERYGWTPFVTIQPHYHMFEREVERELLPYCRAFGVGVIPYFPLAGGFLTGKYQKGEAPPKDSRGASSPYVQGYFTERNFAILEELKAFAAEHGRSVAELAIAWLLAEPLVTSVICGATSPEQVEHNAKAATWALTDEERQRVNQLLERAEGTG